MGVKLRQRVDVNRSWIRGRGQDDLIKNIFLIALPTLGSKFRMVKNFKINIRKLDVITINW